MAKPPVYTSAGVVLVDAGAEDVELVEEKAVVDVVEVARRDVDSRVVDNGETPLSELGVLLNAGVVEVSDDELEVTITGVEVMSSRLDEGVDVGVDEGVDVGGVDSDELGLSMLSGAETEVDSEVSRLSVELCV